MAENRVQIVITTDARGAVTGIQQVNSELNQLGGSGTTALAGVNSGISSMGAGLTSVLGLIQSFAAAMAAVNAAEMGVGFNKEVEDARLGIATLLAAQGQFVDGQGQQLQGQQRINAALAYSSDLTKQLQVDNLKTTATFQQLLRTFQQTLSPGLSEGLSVDQIRQYTLAMVQAASAMQIPLDMMAEETRSLLKGTITPRNTLIATALGITPDDFGKLQGDADGLFAFIMGKLQAFRDFGQVTQTTYSGLLSNTKDALANVLGKATEPFFESLKGSLQRFTNYAIKVDAITGKITLNPELVNSLELLNDTLRAALALAEALAKALGTVGTAYKAMKEAQKAAALQNTPAGFAGPELSDFTDAQRLERVKKLMADIAAEQKTIANWKAGGVGGSILGAPQIALANLSISAATGALENLRAQMVQAGQDTSGLDACLKSIKQSSSEAATAQDAAASSVGNFSYAADNATMSADRFKEKLKELAHIDAGQLGRELAGEIEKNWARIKVLAEGGDTALANVEVKILDRQRKWAAQNYWANFLNVEPAEKERIAAEGKSADLLAWQERYIYGMGKRAKEAGKAGPVDMDKIDKDMLQFREKMQKLYSELEDLDSDYRANQLEQSGRYYDAESERLDRQARKQKEAYAKEVADAQQAYREMEQKLQGKRGGTAEAWGQLAQLKAQWDQAKKAAGEYGDKVDRNLALTKDMKKAQDDAERAETIARLNLEYGQLTGTMQEQLSLQILLLRAEKDRAVIAKDPAVAAALERNYQAKERELEIERSGSYWDGFFLAAEKYRNSLPTIAQQGKAAFETITRGIDSAADALADFTMTGKMDFASFADSIIKDILRMQYKALLTQMFGGEGGFFDWFKGLFNGSGGGGGILGWITGLFHSGGMAENPQDTRFVHSYLFSGAPRLHDGLAPDELPAILQRGERVLSRKESREYGAGAHPPGVVINVQNKTNTPVTAEKTRTAFDGKRYVVDVILDDYSRGGDIWKMIRGQRNG
jgi:hypothetical protein